MWLSFFRKLPSKLNVKEPSDFQQSEYRKMPISLTLSHFENNFRKPYYSFAKQTTFFLLVILRNLYDESKTNSHFTAKILQKCKRSNFLLFAESACSKICTFWYVKQKFVELNLLCKETTKIGGSEDSNSTISCTKLKLLLRVLLNNSRKQIQQFNTRKVFHRF